MTPSAVTLEKDVTACRSMLVAPMLLVVPCAVFVVVLHRAFMTWLIYMGLKGNDCGRSVVAGDENSLSNRRCILLSLHLNNFKNTLSTGDLQKDTSLQTWQLNIRGQHH